MKNNSRFIFCRAILRWEPKELHRSSWLTKNKKNRMIITEVMAPQVPDINDKTWERLRELRIWVFRLKFSEIVLYKFTLALVDFVFTFLFIHTFHVFFVSHSHFIRYILKKRNVILLLLFSSTYIPNMKAFPFFYSWGKASNRFIKLKFQLRTDFVVLPVVSPTPFTAVK